MPLALGAGHNNHADTNMKQNRLRAAPPNLATGRLNRKTVAVRKNPPKTIFNIAATDYPSVTNFDDFFRLCMTNSFRGKYMHSLLILLGVH